MWHLLQLDWAGVCFSLKRTAAENVLILRADCLPNLTPGVAKGLRRANNGRIHGALLPCCPQLSWGLAERTSPTPTHCPNSHSLCTCGVAEVTNTLAIRPFLLYIVSGPQGASGQPPWVT